MKKSLIDKLERDQVVGIALIAIGMGGLVGGVDAAGWVIFFGFFWIID